ncbi:MAG: methionine--tRNA ligase [Euryarchaeota archaeon]|nr:methionine--tRNA ligase [Euryarchaeota archaeon]
MNNVPHIGNIAGSHLPADIFARFCRLAGYETVFIGGSDEHGTPIEVAARKLGVSPKELTDKYYEVHREIYEWLDISYDNFSRTSREIHHRTTKEFFMKIYENGYVTEGVLLLPYCEHDRRFLPDRYVEGTCPSCGYDSARGDQCERCSTLLNPDELVEPRCVLCGNKPVFKETRHLFLNLDKLEPKLKEWIESRRGVWSPQVYNMAMGWIKEGLKPRCITRDLEWGVKVPLEGYEDKVFYVWFDAPIGYISSTKEWAELNRKPQAWEPYWKGEAKIFHFIGKDNIPFHTIFWPGMLLANGEYALPYRVAGLQYLNYEGDKISKSRGWGIFCENLPKAQLSSDVWRFYLTLIIPETSDTEWKWREFQERVNRELVGNLGNFIYRTLSFIHRYFSGEVPRAELGEEDRRTLEESRRVAQEYRSLLWDVRLRDGLRKVLELSDIGNAYFQAQEPWRKVKEEPERARAALYVCANLCYDLAILMSPFLPKSAAEVARLLGTNLGNLEDVGREKIKPGTKILKPKPLFPKLGDADIERLRRITSRVTKFEEMFASKPEITYDHFSRFDFRVARVEEVEELGDGYFRLSLSLGDAKKQAVAKLTDARELKGRLVAVLANVEPFEVAGERSEVLILRSVSKGTAMAVTLDRDVKEGSRVR